MTTDGPYISKTFGSASPRGRREVISTVDRGIPTDIGEDNRNSGLRRLKSRSWGSIRRWEKENELLFAMIEDESEWLAELFPDEIIAPEFFFFALEDGVLLCKLANLIQEYAEKYGKENNIKIPECHVKYHPRSKTRGQLGQFRARENVTAFLGWCRKHQLPEVILFESNDVVQTEDLREGAREVVICLMEVARRSFKYGVKPPKLIILEKEIDEEERTEGLGSPHSVDSGVDTEISLEVKDGSVLINSEAHNSFSSSENVEINNALNSINVWEDEQKSKVSTTENERPDGIDGSKAKKGNDASQSSNKPQSELDRKVLSLVEEYLVGKIFRLKEGKYIILGRVMFVRMLNEHVLVRIGGGWDGLEHYLMTHVKQGSQSQNPSSTPAPNVIRSTTPISRADTRRTNKPISPAASTNSLAEGKKDDFLPFTPPLQAGLISRGRESPLRKTSRVKDTDEADITRAIRRIENTVSENIQKKTNSNSALDLTASASNCKNCSNNRKLVPRKMATSEFADFSSNVNENGEYFRLEKDAVKSEPSDSQIMDNKLDEGETTILNGDVDAEQKHPVDDGEASGTVDNCMHVVITKNESEEEKAGEKKSQEPQKLKADIKETKSQSKSTVTSARPTGNTKTSSKVDRKTPASKKTTTKSATTTTAKPPPKSVKEKKTGGAAKTGLPAKPIFKVSTATSSTILESKSVSTKASISKSATAGSKSAGMKSEVTKTTTSGVKQSPGKAATKTSAATAKTASVKADPKSKKEGGKKVANGKKSPSGDVTDGAVLSTKVKVNGVSKVAAQTKSKPDAQTPKASASAKSVTSAKAKPLKANGKASSVVDKTKEKISATEKVPAKTVNKSDQSKSASSVKPVTTDSKSKKPTTPSTAKAPSSAGKSNETSKKPAATSKPSSAPSKASITAKSSKQPSKPASAPSSATATKSTTVASKSAKPTTKVQPSTIGDKKPIASKAKSTHVGNKDKVATSSSKAPAAKNGKESKTSKPASVKSTKVEKKDNKKAPKAAADKTKKDIGEKHVSKETVVVEQKEKTNIDSALAAPVDNVEICNKGVSEPIKDSTEAVVVQSTELAQSDETEATELITAGNAQLQSEGEPSKLGSQIGDNQLEKRDESPLLIADGNEVSTELLAQSNDEVKPSLEQFDSQPEVEIKSFEEEFVCKEIEEVAKEDGIGEALSSPTQIQDKADVEGSISSPSKLSRKDTYSIGEDESQQLMEDDKKKVTYEEGEDLVAKGDSEEQDAESTMFDESKLISLEEITAKCDEDDIREGAVAPTPPETPVPDNASAEPSAALEIGDELRFETASAVPSAAEEIATETDTVKSEIEGTSYGVKDTEAYQSGEAPSAAPEQEILPEASSTLEQLSKGNVGDGEDTYVDNSFETESADIKYPGEDSSQIDSSSADVSDRAEGRDMEYEHEALKHDLLEHDDSTFESHSPHVDDSVSDFREPFDKQGIDREADHVSMDTEISDEAEVEKELESSSDVEVAVDPELPAEATTPENVEVADGSEGPQTSDFSQDIVSSQSFGFSSNIDAYQENLGDNVSPNEQNEPYFIGSKGTEELMQREPIEQEKISDDLHGADAPSHVDFSDKLKSEAGDEKEEAGDLEEEQEELENGENVESYGISVNEVSISVAQSYNQEAGISPVDNESHLPERSVYDSVLVNAQESGECDVEAVFTEQGHSDSNALGDDALVTADGGQNEILNPDIGLQENGAEEEKAQDSEEYKEAAYDEEEMEDANEDTLKHLDLEHQEADSSLMEDQFTPISDLTDDLRSPLAKESFSNFVSEGQEECEYEDKSDAEEEEFNNEAIELAKESVRVARSLDDSCEEETLPSNSQAPEDDVMQRLDGDFESEDQGLPAQHEVSSFPSTAAPQIISSPCMSSDEEQEEEENVDQGDKPSDVLVGVVPDLDTQKGVEEVSQNSPIPVDPATADFIAADPVTTDGVGFPDVATAETLSDIYRAEAESHDIRLGYEMQLSEDQDMKVSGAREELSVDEDGIKSEKFIMEPGVGLGSDSFIEGNDASYGDQGAESFSITGGTEKFSSSDGIEEVSDIAMEIQKDFDNASRDELGSNAQFQNDEEEVTTGLDKASFDVMQNEDHGQDFENSQQSAFLEEDMHGGDIGAHVKEIEGVIPGTQLHGLESTSYEEMEKKCDEANETFEERPDGVFIGSTAEEDEIAQEGAFEDHVTSSLERSDAERNIQSDDQTTDSSDFVLLDSPVKQVRAGNSDEVIAENDAEPQDILQASLKESDSGDSPFHHIELKTEETKGDEAPEKETPDEEAPNEEAAREEAPDEEAPEEQTDHPAQKEDLSGKDNIQDTHFLEEKFGTIGLEDQMLSVSSTVEEQSDYSIDMQMNSSQSPNLFWQADMREEGKEFRSDLLEEDDESKMKFNKLMSENLNTGGPRYVYDGSDDEDGGDDYDDDDDTY